MVVGVNILEYSVENRSSLTVDVLRWPPVPIGFVLECDNSGCYRWDAKCINNRLVFYLVKTDHANRKVIIMKEYTSDLGCNEHPHAFALVGWRKGRYRIALLYQNANGYVELSHVLIDPVNNDFFVTAILGTDIPNNTQTYANVVHPVERVFISGFGATPRIYEIHANAKYYDTGVNSPVSGYFIRWHCYGPGKVYGAMHYWIPGSYSRIVVLDRYAKSIQTIDRYESGCGMWHGSTPLPDGYWLWYGGSCATGYGETRTWLKVDPGAGQFTPIDVSSLKCGGNAKYAIYGGWTQSKDVILATCVEVNGTRFGAAAVTISGNTIDILAVRDADAGTDITPALNDLYWHGSNPPEIYNGNVYKQIAYTNDMSRMYFAEYTGIEEPFGVEVGAPTGLIPTILKLTVNVMP